MNEQRRNELAMIAADDELLDLLAVGGRPAADDAVGAMLAAWRADIVTGPPPVRPAAPGLVPRSQRPSRDRPPRRFNRLLIGAAAAVIALAGTVAVLAVDARPDSPLWPITRLLYGDRASSAVAEQQARQAIEDAQQAVDDGQYGDAQQLLDQATALLDQIEDAATVQRLREKIDELRGVLADLLPVPIPPPTSRGGAAGGSTGGGGPGGSSASPTTAQGGILPTCLPLPTLNLPLPSGLLPTLPVCP